MATGWFGVFWSRKRGCWRLFRRWSSDEGLGFHRRTGGGFCMGFPARVRRRDRGVIWSIFDGLREEEYIRR